jgi:DNA-binding NarL/FixJ family response regulator
MRILVADDHAAMRHSLTEVLACEPDMEVVGEAPDGYAAVRLAKDLHPDIVIMDVSMPVLNGIEATRQIMRDCPGTRVIGLSMHASRGYVTQMLQAGASGYLVKNGNAEELLQAMEAVSHGQTYLSAEVTNYDA